MKTLSDSEKFLSIYYGNKSIPEGVEAALLDSFFEFKSKKNRQNSSEEIGMNLILNTLNNIDKFSLEYVTGTLSSVNKMIEK